MRETCGRKFNEWRKSRFVEILIDNMPLSFRIQLGLIEARFIRVISGRGI